MKKMKLFLMIMLPVFMLGCASMSEHFKCNDDDEEVLKSAAVTPMGNGLIIRGKGVYFPDGTFCAFTDACIEKYVAVRKEMNAKAKYWEIKIGSDIPGFVVDFVRDEGMKREDIALTERGYDRHRYEITAYYWCGNRGVRQACERWYGIPHGDKSAEGMLLDAQNRKLEKWEPGLNQFLADYESITLEGASK